MIVENVMLALFSACAGMVFAGIWYIAKKILER